MHDVLDLRDLVPDEAEQLAHSGYEVGELLGRARAAAARDDLADLDRIAAELEALTIDTEWPYDEPDSEAELLALAERARPLVVDMESLSDRIRGAWLGRAVANTMGKPIEGLPRADVERYLRAGDDWPQTGYVRLVEPHPHGVGNLHESAPYSAAGTFSDVPRDDDLDWTILGLHMLEKYGRGLTTQEIAAEWLDCLPFTQTFTAERAAYRNLIQRVPIPQTATHRNPYREWIGALIRADVFGFVNPGDPAAAARLAIVDARLSHIRNGIYGEMWAAALVASALGVDDARSAIEASLKVVPPGSRLGLAVQSILDLHASGVDHVAALDHVDRELGHYNWVHTINNAAIIAVGLLWGRSFTETVAITIAGGNDTDSTAATAGSVYGALHGAGAIPERLVGTTHVHVRSAVRGFDRITVDELAQRTLRLIPGANS